MVTEATSAASSGYPNNLASELRTSLQSRVRSDDRKTIKLNKEVASRPEVVLISSVRQKNPPRYVRIPKNFYGFVRNDLTNQVIHVRNGTAGLTAPFTKGAAKAKAKKLPIVMSEKLEDGWFKPSETDGLVDFPLPEIAPEVSTGLGKRTKYLTGGLAALAGLAGAVALFIFRHQALYLIGKI